MGSERTDENLSSPFALSRTDVDAWAIIDRSVTASDKHHIVARIREIDEASVSVQWMQQLPLSEIYLSPEAVLEDLHLWSQRSKAWSRPIPIPHRPPLAHD